ncbi:MAG: sugar transporter [Prevotella sp.]|nr:sugar transporter [Prevotella sp.]
MIQIIVGFYSRKVFLEYLGDEVIGLNTTLGNILSFLNLSELGIGMAMATSLYKPIHDNDQETIVDILTVQGILYKRIAWLLCGMSIPILIAMPYIFPSTECSIVYAYVAYLVFLSGSIFSYLWNYRQILIQADQKNFKLMPWIHGVRYSKIFLQIALLMLTPLGIWGWIGAELAGGIVTVFAINHVIRKEYPWLHSSKESAKNLLPRYKSLMTKVKQLFAHKIGTFVLHQTSPLIIYAFVSLEKVTYYGNYMMLIGYCMTLMNVIFGGLSASIGNLIADNNKRHTMEVFWELFTSRVWIAGIACFGIYIFVGPFISLWLGSRYVFDESTLLLLILYMFIQISRTVIESFKDAYQLFADVWSPIAESCLNLGCSILFGYLWGLNGVLMGVNLSLIIIILLWKPYYTFRYGLKSSVLLYYMQYAFHTGVLITGAIVAKWVMVQFNYEYSDLISLSLVLLLGMTVFILTTYTILMLSTKGMRMFSIRIKNILSRKI